MVFYFSRTLTTCLGRKAMEKMRRFYRKVNEKFEYCFNIQIRESLTEIEFKQLTWLLAETFDPDNFSTTPFIAGERVVEIGPRMNFSTAWNTNALSIFRSCGIAKIIRVERSRRYKIPADVAREEFIRSHHDRLTEAVYANPLATFATGVIPEAVYTIPLKEEGPDVLARLPGISMDAFVNSELEKLTK